MPTREEMINEIRASRKTQYPSRDQMIADIRSHASQSSEPTLMDNVKDGATEMGMGLLKGAGWVGEKVDRVTGAPTRAAISSLQDDMTDLPAAGRAFKSQFGEPANIAPTGKDIVKRAGVPDTAMSEYVPSIYSETGKGLSLKKGGLLDPSASGLLGLGMDVIADPTTLTGVGTIGKIGKGVAGTAKNISKGIGAAADASSAFASKAGTKMTAKVGELVSGVPAKEVETYVKHFDDVQKLIKEYGDNIPEAADKIREGFQSSIRAKRMELGNRLESALNALPNEKVIDANPIVEELLKVQGKMNKTLRIEEVSQVDELVNRVRAVAGESGNITPKELNDIKVFLQDRGSGAFMKDGQIFVPGKDAQIAAKNASRIARQTLNKVSPTVAEANNSLSQLHSVEQKMNKNLIAPGKSESALLAAGSGQNQRNIKNIQRLEEITGAPMMANAEKLSAAKRFSNPGLTSADSTGKGVERALKAGLIGTAIGGAPAGLIATAATSPLTLKLAIQGGRIPVKAIQAVTGSVGKITDEVIQRAYKALQTDRGQKIFGAIVEADRASGPSLRGGLLKSAADNGSNQPDRQPAKRGSP